MTILLQQLLNIGQQTAAAKATRPLEERYNDSSDFDADMDKIIDHLAKALDLITGADFVGHMVDTDQNYNTDTVQSRADLEDEIADALKAARDFYDGMAEID